MTREVVSLRLSGEEKAAIEAAARSRRITPSELIRQAALLVAHRVAEAAKKPKPKAVVVEPDPRRDPGPHVMRTYRSFAEYRSGGGGVALFAADCVDARSELPVFDVL